MKKFHVTSDGDVRPCSATLKACRYSEAEHYGSQKEAQKAYEGLKEKELLNPAETKLKLSNILDLELLNRMVKEKYVNVASHPLDDELKILTYSNEALIHAKWNEATKVARGLIIRSKKNDFSDAVIIQRPWRKFFSIEQVTSQNGETAWALKDDENESAIESQISGIDFNSPAEVTDKLDGSLGVLYRSPDGLPAFATKGSFSSDPAIMFTKILRNNPEALAATEKLLQEHSDTTFTFELIGRDNTIVVEYDENEPRLIGAIVKHSGVYKSPNDYSDVWDESKGLKTTETMQAASLNEAFALADRSGKEGVVVRIKSDDPNKQILLKIKQDDYKMMHRLATGFSYKSMRQVVRELPMTKELWLEVARTKNVSVIPEISEIVNVKPAQGFSTKAMVENRNKEFADVLIPAAEKIAKSYNIVESLTQKDFDDPNFSKNLYNKYKNDNTIDSIIFSLARNKKNNEVIEESFEAQLRSIAQRIKRGKDATD